MYDRVRKFSGKYECLLAERYKLWLLVNVTISARPGLLGDTFLSFESASSSPFVGLMLDMSGVNVTKMCHTNAANVTTQSLKEDLTFRKRELPQMSSI